MKQSSITAAAGPPVNHLLAALDKEALLRITPHLQSVLLQAKQILYRAEAHMHHIFLPETAVLCMLTQMEDGRSVESATVGREGASWVSASVSAPSMPCQTMVAIGGRAQRLGIRYLEEESQRNGSLHQVLTRYSHALLIQVLRTGACNALHTVQQRSARWMLETLDQTDEDSFAVTHDFLASLIGCGRSVLTLVLRDMEEAGAVKLHRGWIHIQNRKKLEGLGCECYKIIRRNHEFSIASTN